MTKIVINRCYGGFGISEAGLIEYARIKGIALYPDKSDSLATTYWTIPKDHPERIAFKEWQNRTGKNEEEYRKMVKIYDKYTIYARDIERDDPALVQMVENLGEKASDSCSRLVIEEIEKGTLYRIEEYDGLESIETKDSYTWKVAR